MTFLKPTKSHKFLQHFFQDNRLILAKNVPMNEWPSLDRFWRFLSRVESKISGSFRSSGQSHSVVTPVWLVLLSYQLSHHPAQMSRSYARCLAHFKFRTNITMPLYHLISQTLQTCFLCAWVPVNQQSVVHLLIFFLQHHYSLILFRQAKTLGWLRCY